MVTPAEAVDYFRLCLKKGKGDLVDPIKNLFNEILAPDSGKVGSDNMTCILVEFREW